MEYGVFLGSSVNWNLIWIALSLILAGALFLVMGSHSEKVHEEKAAIFGDRISGDVKSIKNITDLLLFISFFAAFVLIIIGFVSGCFGDAPGQGAYKVADANLFYEGKSVYNEQGYYKRDKEGNYLYKPVPHHFELKLEGRADSSHSSNMRIVRIIDIPYDRVAENYKYLPKEPPGERASSRIFSVAIAPPGFAIKYKDNWWQFTDTGPEK